MAIDSKKVAAGILIYINELTPGDKELLNLKQGIDNGTTDILPTPHSSDEQLIRMWCPGDSTDQISLDFRISRAIRVIPIISSSTVSALQRFDDVVKQAEEDVVQETNMGDILHTWSPNCIDEDTCSACDFRHFCPKPANASTDYQVKTPSAP